MLEKKNIKGKVTAVDIQVALGRLDGISGTWTNFQIDSLP